MKFIFGQAIPTGYMEVCDLWMLLWTVWCNMHTIYVQEC